MFKKLSNTSCSLPFGACQHNKLWSTALVSFMRNHFFDWLYFDRVNSAFLAKLEGQRRGSENEPEWETERFNMASEEFRHQPSDAPGHQLPPTHLRPDPEQHRAEEAGELRMDVWITLCPLFLTPFFSLAQCWLTEPKSDMWQELPTSSFLRALWLCLVCVKSKALRATKMQAEIYAWYVVILSLLAFKSCWYL